MKGYIVTSETFETAANIVCGAPRFEHRFDNIEEARAEFERQAENIKRQYRVDFENNIGFDKKYIGITLNECEWNSVEDFEDCEYPETCEAIDEVTYDYKHYEIDQHDGNENWWREDD